MLFCLFKIIDFEKKSADIKQIKNMKNLPRRQRIKRVLIFVFFEYIFG